MSYKPEIVINTEFQAQTNLELHLSKSPFNYVWMFHFFHQHEFIKLSK